jgi:DNA polymerase III subunit epsilon
MKKFYFDVETTGLDASKHGLIQIAGIIEIDNEVKEKFNFKVNIFENDQVSQDALDKNHTTLKQIKTFEDPEIVKNKLIAIFDRYIDKYNKNDKFTPIGYNVSFDIKFLETFLKKCNFNYFWSYFQGKAIDVYSIVLWLYFSGKIKDIENHKLETLCNHFDIPLNAHDALEDVLATMELLEKLNCFLK